MTTLNLFLYFSDGKRQLLRPHLWVQSLQISFTIRVQRGLFSSRIGGKGLKRAGGVPSDFLGLVDQKPIIANP